MTMIPEERKAAREAQIEIQCKLKLAQRYQLQILCGACLAPCELIDYDHKGEGGRWQCSRDREHWD